MKNLLKLIILFCTFSINAQNEWHVKPAPDNGNLLGNGLTLATAWSLQNALNNPGGVIVAGDIIWLHGGDYKGNFVSSANLVGTATNYIKIKSFPGEWARLDGNVFPYVVPTTNLLPSLPATILSATVDEELQSYDLYERRLTLNGTILKVESAFTQFEDLEITCLGAINRLRIVDYNEVDCTNNTNGFRAMTGIDHNTTTVNKFINLVIRNIPGVGIGSWKYTDNTEIYGCLIYNNGYINNSKSTCSSTTSYVNGKGPGIYSQNASASLSRLIRNNIFMNNYDSGLFVWSATSNPAFDYLKNFTISKNIFVNNGGPQRDETSNMIVRSQSGNAFNHPSNINIDNNVFYINNRSSYVSGIYVSNSLSVKMRNNFLFKGTAGMVFANDNLNIDFKNNFYQGKRQQVLATPAEYLSKNWKLDFNTYYSMVGSLDMFHVQFSTSPPSSLPQIRYSLPQFQALYNDELNSTRAAAGTPSDIRYLTNTIPPKKFITQNSYNPNKFYITLWNPNPLLAIYDNIDVDLTNYNIPTGSSYNIKDAENYFGISISGTTTSNIISFPMTTLTTIELPTGVAGIDYVTTPEHSFNDLHVFVLEFDCVNSSATSTLTVQNQTDTTVLNYLNRSVITFGTNYIADINAKITSKASSTIVFVPNAHVKAGSQFLAKIENGCNKLPYVGERSNFSRQASTTLEESIDHLNLKNESIIFPNPNDGNFKISLKKFKSGVVNVLLKNMFGKVVFESKQTDQLEINVMIADLQQGIYILEVNDDDQKLTEKIIIH